MFLKIADRYPGGRILVLLLPVVLFVLGWTLLDIPTLIQVTNAVNLALAAALTFSWRRLILIFLKEDKDAANIWLSLSIFLIVVVTVANIAYSLSVRAYGIPQSISGNSWFVAFVKFGYSFAFGSLYLVPLARGSEVPPRGWLSLGATVAVAVVISLALMWWF